MRKKLFFLFISLLFLASFYPEKKYLYLISGTPTPINAVNFASRLYRIEGESLKFIREISNKIDGVDSIRPFYDDGLVIVASPSVKPESLKIVKMDDPISENFIQIESNNCHACSIIEYHCLKNLSNNVIFVSIFMGDGITQFQAWDLGDGKKIDSNSLDLKNVLASGIPGGVVPGDVIYMSAGSDGALYFVIGDRKFKTDWYLPKDIVFSEKDVIVAYINTKNMLVLSSKDNKKRSYEGIGSSSYYFLNKKSALWEKVVFSGGRTEIRSFGNWIAGYVADMSRKEGAVSEDITKKVISETGNPIDWRIEMANVYLPGELFLFNIYTKEKHVIKTGEPDSEILFVDDKFIYLRIKDQIFKKKIYDQVTGNGELLIKSDSIVDVHWAFLGF